jgi:hypothetical protein
MSTSLELKLTFDIEFSNNIFFFDHVIRLVSSHC